MHGDPALPPDFAHLPYANPDAPKGGELILGEVGTFDSLNPFNVRGTPALNLQLLVWETLMQRSADEPFTLYGLLAEAIETPEDRTWVAFRLNAQARFADGTPVTAGDVVASYEALRAKGRPNHRNFYGKVARVERPDARTIRFVFGPEGNRELPLIMGLMPVLPKAWIEAHPLTETWLTPPLGSGPYAIADAVPGRGVTYRYNPDWWGRDLPVNRGFYNFQRIRLDYYREANAAFEAFKSGQYHIRKEIDAKRWARGYRFRALSDGRAIKEDLTHGRPSGLYGLFFNTRRAPFNQAKVREALSLAFDFDWANRNLYAGQFRRIDGMFGNSDLANPALKSPSGGGPQAMRPHFARALALLREAGFSVHDGLLADAGGEPLAIEILNTDADLEKLLLLYARNLARLGISLRIRSVDATQFAGRRNAFDFDMIPFTLAGTLSPGNEQAFRWGSAAADAAGSFNLAGVKNPEADRLIAAIAGARTRDELRAAAQALDALIMGGHYAVPLYFQPADYVARWRFVERPERTPVTGYRFETWWRKP